MTFTRTRCHPVTHVPSRVRSVLCKMCCRLCTSPSAAISLYHVFSPTRSSLSLSPALFILCPPPPRPIAALLPYSAWLRPPLPLVDGAICPRGSWDVQQPVHRVRGRGKKEVTMMSLLCQITTVIHKLNGLEYFLYNLHSSKHISKCFFY